MRSESTHPYHMHHITGGCSDQLDCFRSSPFSVSAPFFAWIANLQYLNTLTLIKYRFPVPQFCYHPKDSCLCSFQPIWIPCLFIYRASKLGAYLFFSLGFPIIISSDMAITIRDHALTLSYWSTPTISLFCPSQNDDVILVHRYPPSV